MQILSWTENVGGLERASCVPHKTFLYVIVIANTSQLSIQRRLNNIHLLVNHLILMLSNYPSLGVSGLLARSVIFLIGILYNYIYTYILMH